MYNKMPDYSRSKIYKIVCNITGEEYYGSTTASLNTRLSDHVYKVKSGKTCCKSKQIIKRCDYKIVLCEECPCDSIEQLRAFERKWISQNNCVNKIVPTRTATEYYNDHKEERKEYQRKYRIANIEKMKNYQREYSIKMRALTEQIKMECRHNKLTANYSTD